MPVRRMPALIIVAVLAGGAASLITVTGQRRRLPSPLAVLVGLALLAACSESSVTPGPSSQGSTQPSVAAERDASACSDSTLLAPDGSRVSLTGEWSGDWFDIPPSSGQRTFVLQVGECVWMSISDDQFRERPTESGSLLAEFSGTITGDSIPGRLVTIYRWVDPFVFGEQPVMTALSLRITWDEAGAMILIEDREPGVQGPRCPNPVMWCPDPTVLHPVSAAPAASPTAAP